MAFTGVHAPSRSSPLFRPPTINCPLSSWINLGSRRFMHNAWYQPHMKLSVCVHVFFCREWLFSSPFFASSRALTAPITHQKAVELPAMHVLDRVLRGVEGELGEQSAHWTRFHLLFLFPLLQALFVIPSNNAVQDHINWFFYSVPYSSTRNHYGTMAHQVRPSAILPVTFRVEMEQGQHREQLSTSGICVQDSPAGHLSPVAGDVHWATSSRGPGAHVHCSVPHSNRAHPNPI